MFDETLHNIAKGLTIREIMIPGERLVTASDLPSAVQLLEKHPDFNLIPIQNPQGRLTAFVDRHNPQEQTINLHHHVVSDSISILDIVDILKERQFCFVMVDDKIGGYIHFSDLSNRTAELAFYILIQAVEHHLIEQIRPRVTLESLLQALDKKRAKTIKDKFNNKKMMGVELDLLRELSLKDIIEYAKHFGSLDIDTKEIEGIYHVRNSISHAAAPFIQKHQDVARLARVKESCYEILGISKDFHTPTRR